MENARIDKIYERVEQLKEQIQSKGYIDSETFKELEVKVNELNDMVRELDKDIAIKQEKQTQIYMQINRLDEMIKEIKTNSNYKDDKKKDIIEKILLLVVGGIISFVFNKL